MKDRFLQNHIDIVDVVNSNQQNFNNINLSNIVSNTICINLIRV